MSYHDPETIQDELRDDLRSQRQQDEPDIYPQWLEEDLYGDDNDPVDLADDEEEYYGTLGADTFDADDWDLHHDDPSSCVETGEEPF